jgi:hypothetical protein
MQSNRGAYRFDRSTWVITSGKHERYLLVSYREGTSLVISIGIIKNQDEDSEEHMFVIDSEVWSGAIDTVCPSNSLQDLVVDFAKCKFLSTPVELVYEWGGMVSHQFISITNKHRGPLQ